MKQRILIVDDEEGIRATFKNILERAGYEVAASGSYEQAEHVLDGQSFDAVFADILLGGKTGIELLKRIKEKDRNCPVVMITGVPQLDTASDAVRFGAFDYIPKPVTQKVLLRSAKLAVDHKEALDQKEKYLANLDAIFKGTMDAIVMVDNNMVITEANERVRDVCNQTRENVMGASVRELCGYCTGKCVSVVEQTIKTGTPHEVHRIECGVRNKERQKVTIFCSPLVTKSDHYIGAVIIMRDESHVDFLERRLKERSQYHELIGRSGAMQDIYVLIDKVADVDSTVLITGESGTGKELIAKAIHDKSDRRGGPFIVVNCGALPETLLESELFGHVKGSFTGAAGNRTGRLELAHKGTIFLDEIGEISNAVQVELLRVIQNREITRVGESKPVKVDVRIIAATNRDLTMMIKKGEFREDLFYRLKVVEIHVPPLREKKNDIPLLTTHFLGKIGNRFEGKSGIVSEDVLDIFMNYHWPGNIRELEHAIEHALVVSKSGVIRRPDLPKDILEGAGGPTTHDIGDEDKERDAIMNALEKVRWNKSRAADELGFSRRTLYRKMERLGIHSGSASEL